MYWNNDEYYGVGAGASGYVNGVRYRNRGPIQHYLKAIAEDGHARLNEEHLTKVEMMEEEFFLGLRKSRVCLSNGLKRSLVCHLRILMETLWKNYRQMVSGQGSRGCSYDETWTLSGDSVAEQFILED